MIRKAEKRDIPGLMNLLRQVAAVHHDIRPDLFRNDAAKYSEDELEALVGDEATPVFVYTDDEGRVLGHAFCQLTEVSGHRLLHDARTLYIDDICVDEQARGRHIGQTLFRYVSDYARQQGCSGMTLNVWEGNDAAYSFYRHMGMRTQKTGMETIL